MSRHYKSQLINGTWYVRAWDDEGNKYESFTDDAKTEDEAIENAFFSLREVAIESRLMEQDNE